MSVEDQRKHPRHTPSNLTFVALRPDFSHFGKVIDISGGGLRFQFMGMPVTLAKKPRMTLDLFVHGNGYYLSDVPCELVHEANAESPSTGPVATCRYGLRFKDVTRSQADQLDYYLEHYTVQ